MNAEGKRIVFASAVALSLLPLLYAATQRPIIDNEPVQPIDFFHSVHAGVKQIQCGYCHRETARASFAGMPSTQLCMRCHRVIIPNFPEIQKLHRYWDTGQAVPWVRVNRLPGFVFFSHDAHIAAKVPCTTCHGDLTRMDRVRQVAPLTMGWCLKCHRSRKAPTQCVTCHR